MSARRQRWVVIGDVRSGWFVCARGAGIPGGFLVSWRGRVSWCQPVEFVTAAALDWAVTRRLALAGLRPVASNGWMVAGGWRRMAMLVERCQKYKPELNYE